MMKKINQSRDGTFILFALLSMALAFLATDIYLPALPAIRLSLQASVYQVQQTLTTYMFGLAIAQIIAGPFIDHLGCRRLILPASIALVLLSLACALTFRIGDLTVLRAFQGFFAGAIGVTARASFVHRFDSEKTQHIFMAYGPWIILTSVIAPSLGGVLVHVLGWRWVFGFLALYGAVVFIGLKYCFILQEPTSSSRSWAWGKVWQGYWEVLCHGPFMGCLMINAMYLAMVFSYAAEAPFIFYHFGYSPSQIGISFVPIAVAFLLSSQCNRFFFSRYLAFWHMVLIALGCVVVGMGVLALSGTVFNSALPMIVGIAIASLGMGISSPAAFGRAITFLPHRAGYASSMVSAIPFLIGSFLTLIVHPLCGTNVLRLGLFLLAIVAICVICYAFLSREIKNPKLNSKKLYFRK